MLEMELCRTVSGVRKDLGSEKIIGRIFPKIWSWMATTWNGENMRILIPLGGKAFLKRGQPMTAGMQRNNIRGDAPALAERNFKAFRIQSLEDIISLSWSKKWDFREPELYHAGWDNAERLVGWSHRTTIFSMVIDRKKNGKLIECFFFFSGSDKISPFQ